MQHPQSGETFVVIKNKNHKYRTEIQSGLTRVEVQSKILGASKNIITSLAVRRKTQSPLLLERHRQLPHSLCRRRNVRFSFEHASTDACLREA